MGPHKTQNLVRVLDQIPTAATMKGGLLKQTGV
jgi:hypothetical protein